MSTPNEPQDPYATGGQPDSGAPQPPAEPRYPAAPPYGAPTAQPAQPGYPAAPQYGAPPAQPGYPGAPQYGAPPAQPGYPAAPQYGATPYPAAPQYAAAPGYAGGYAYPKNSLAVWSLVLAILGMVLLCGLFTGIPAVIIGNNAKRAVAAGEANNGGLATAGVVVGWIAIALSVIVVAVVALLVSNAGGWTEYVNTYSTTP